MDSLNFIKSSTEVMLAIRECATEEGFVVGGKTWTVKNKPSTNQVENKLELCSDEELDTLLNDLGYPLDERNAPELKSADEIVIDMSQEEVIELTNAKGVKYQGVLGTYDGESSNGFRFILKSGGIITFGGDTMFQIWNAGGLTEGYKMCFKPQSIRPSEHLGYYTGVPNYDADSRLSKLMSVNGTNKKIIRASIAEIKALNLPKSVQESRINGLVDDILEKPKLVKLQF